MNRARYRDPWWKPAPERSGPQTGAKVYLPTVQQPQAHSQANTGMASGQVSECSRVAQSEPGLEPYLTSLERIENRCTATLLIQPDKAWEEKLPKYRCAKLVAPYPRRLDAVIAAKSASRKYWVKGLNTYVIVIFHFFHVFLCRYWVVCVDRLNSFFAHQF